MIYTGSVFVIGLEFYITDMDCDSHCFFKPFKVAVIGLDEKKIKFKRKFSTKIVPLDVDLLVDTEEGMLLTLKSI